MLFSTALLALLAASASAVPAPAPFTVEGLRRRQDAPIAEQIAATKAKYAQTNKLALLSIAEGLLPKTIGDVLSQLGLKQRRAAVALTDNASGGVDIDYYGATLIGTPSQTIQQDFDTGSSDLWVPVNCNNCGSTPQYKASSSSTYKATTTPFKIQYGSGDVNGTVAFDAVKLGGYSTSSQALGAASSVSSQFANSPSSGLTGLAWPAIASIRNQPTLTQSLKVPVYGYSIHRSSSSKSNYLDVGALVSSRYTGNISYTNVVSKTYWQVSATGFNVNGKSASGSFYAAIDTGTTLLYAPSSAVASFWSAIPGSSSNGDGSYSYPCNFSGAVGISFANTGVIKMSNADLKYYQSTSTTCVGSVIAQDFSDAYGNPLAIVGDVFIKSSYTIFDVSNARVGFATAA